MTDKELKKLSRLELLELLLAESRENERLREEIEKLKQENTIIRSAQQLNETSESLDETSVKLSAALEQVSSIINGLDKISFAARTEETVVASEKEDENCETDETETDETETEIFLSDTNEEAVNEMAPEEEKSVAAEEAVIKDEQSDISKRLDVALKLVASRIEELDRIAVLVNSKLR